MNPVLDVFCGSKMFWFDKHDERATYCDKRRERSERRRRNDAVDMC